jgi:hypothetical protein
MMCHSCDKPARYVISVTGIATHPALCVKHAEQYLNRYLRPDGDERYLADRIERLRVSSIPTQYLVGVVYPDGTKETFELPFRLEG